MRAVVWAAFALLSPAALADETAAAPRVGANVPEVGFGSIRTPAERRVRLALERDFPEVWEETTLGDWAEIFGGKLGVRVVLDRDGLEAQGLSGDTPFEFDARSQSAGDALRRVFARLRLRAMPRGGLLRIVSREDAERPEHLVTGVYPIEDLPPRPNPDDPRTVTGQPWIDLVQESCGERATWFDQGGSGRVRFFAVDGLSCLVVRASAQTQVEVEELLAHLRAGRERARLAGRAEPAAEDFAIGAGSIRTAADRRLRQALASPRDEAWEETTIGEWAERLTGKLGVPVVLDTEGLDAEGVSVDTPFDFLPRGQRLEDALPRLLARHRLTAIPQRGVLIVTGLGYDRDPEYYLRGIYGIDDLMPPPTVGVRTPGPAAETRSFPGGGLSGMGSPGGGFAGELAPPAPAYELAELVTRLCGERADWDVQGGSATVRPFALEGYLCLCVSAPYSAHRDLEELLAALRNLRRAAEPQRQAARGEAPPVGFGMIRTAADRAVRLALDRTFAEAWPEMSLGAWAGRLEAKIGIPVVLDATDLAERKLSSDARLVFAPRGQRLRDALPRALRQVGARAVPERGVLRIAGKAAPGGGGKFELSDSEQEAYESARWGLYDVRDVTTAESADDFVQMVMRQCGERTAWDDQGGAGEARVLSAEGRAYLVVRAPPVLHYVIEDFLFDLRAMRTKRPSPAGPVAPQPIPKQQVADNPPVARPGPVVPPEGRRPPFVLPEPPLGSGLVRSPADLDLRRALDRPYPGPIPYRHGKLTLPEWAARLEQALGCPVSTDRRALDAEGWIDTRDFEPIARGETFREMLDLELGSLGFAAVPTGGTLRITSRRAADAAEAMRTAVYDVRDLLIRTHDDGERTLAADDLVALVTENCGLPDGWSEVGGAGYVDFFTVDGLDCLILRNTPAAHRDLELLLAQLRYHRRPPPHALPAAVLDARPMPPPAVGEGTVRTRADRVLRLGLERLAEPPPATTTPAAWAADFERLLGAPVKLDFESSAVDGIDGETLLRPIGGALRLRERAAATLGPLGLAAVPTNGTLRIVAAADSLAESNFLVGTYDLRDLLQRTDPYGKRRPTAAADEFVGLVKSHCGPSIVWDDFGGTATAEFGTGAGAARLTVKAPFENHRQLEDLLDSLRRIRRAAESLPARPHARQWSHRNTDSFPQFRAHEGNPFEGLPAEPAPRDEASPDPAPALEDDPSRRRAAEATNAFGLELYRRVLAETPPRGTVRAANVLISPYATASALATFVGGTEGEVAEALAARLHPGRTAAEYPAGLAALRRSLPFDRGWEGCRTVAAGKLWTRQGLVPQPDFAARLRERLGFGIEGLDFARPDRAARAVDAFLLRETRGLIPSAGLSDEDFPPDTALFLTSALTFDGVWQHPFEGFSTRREPFFAFETELRHPSMRQSGRFRHAVTAEAEWLRLPYGAGTLEMWVMLPPNDRASWRQAAESLSTEKLATVAATARERKVDLLLPTLKLDLPLDLIPPLRKLGLKALFDETRPFVLPGIGTRDPVSLRTFRQQARLEVDERGTRAAAAVLGAGGFGGMVVEEKPYPFRVDHPFHFVIRDARTGLLLFVGGITNPNSPSPSE